MALTFKQLVDHPFSFAVGVGVANGLLAVSRNKKIDVPTALTLSAILGLGETALVMYEPESERAFPLTTIAVYSVLGVLVGVVPFITRGGHGEEHGGSPALPIAQATPNGQQAVAGWSVPRRARRRV